jgi:hypothetical protein
VLIEVPEFEWENASLLFSVFVAKAKFDSGLISPLRPVIAQFEEFQIILPPVFLNLRSLPTGDVVVVSTSSPVINGVKSEEHVQYYSESLPIGEFINFHFNCLGRLRDKMLERTQNLLGMRYSELAYTIENPLVTLLSLLEGRDFDTTKNLIVFQWLATPATRCPNPSQQRASSR